MPPKNKAAGYSESATSDETSVSTLKHILNKKVLMPHIASNDKIPNYDGTIEVLDNDRIPIGELKVQVKTLRKNYKKAHNIGLKLLQYAKTVQLPFLLIAVDQANSKAFWTEISHERANGLIDEVLAKRQSSVSILFEENHEISMNCCPYNAWKAIVENHIEVLSNANATKSELVLTKETLRVLKLNSLDFIDQNIQYKQIHIFLDTLNHLFDIDFKIVKQLFTFDFWKLGIITFGSLTEDRISYSLVPINWDENAKQINKYAGKDEIMEFAGNYPSIQVHSGRNPVLDNPKEYALERISYYLKLSLQRKMFWPINNYLISEFIFFINDTRFKSSQSELEDLNILDLKSSIENALKLTPQLAGLDNPLIRALDYIQKIRIDGIDILSRKSPSKNSIQEISLCVGTKAVLPENYYTILFNYWNAVIISYEETVEELFPTLKDDLKLNPFVIIPFIATYPNATVKIASIKIIELLDNDIQTPKLIVVKNVIFENYNRTINYNGVKYSVKEIEARPISKLTDDLPVRKGVYELLLKKFEYYFKHKL